MAAIVLFFLLMVEVSMIAAQQRNTRISLGSSLTPTTSKSSWLSDSGQFAFGFYQQGNGFAVGIWYEKIKQNTVVWTANRDDKPLSHDVTLLLNGDGRLVVQDQQGLQILIANSSLPAASASMLDSGNFVLFNSNSKNIWQSFDFPTDTLLPGQRIVGDYRLVAAVSETNHSSGRFRLVLQLDGNLVQYPAGSPLSSYYSYWSSSTENRGENVSLNLDSNGQLYLLNSTGFNIKTIVAGQNQLGNNVTYRMTIDVDGILRLYSHSLVPNSSWVAEWVSISNKCDPVGLCGLNSYCILINNQESDCACLPGFDFIDQNQKNLGCRRNSSIDSCTVERNEMVSLAELDEVMWENNPYSVVSLMNKTDCEEDCLTDCNCIIALFENQQCNKQMFPLRFAKAGSKGLVTTIIKVPNGSNLSHKKGQRRDVLIIGLACIAFALIILLLSAFLLCRNRFQSHKNVPNKLNAAMLMVDEELFVRSFTFRELELATDGFVQELGRGAFGTVYKGTLSFPSGQRAIAVKRLEKVAVDGEVEFRNEMRSIGRTHHRNLLRLLGYCHEGSNRLLVYDYMSNGSLANFLFKSEVKPTWNERVGIAMGIARGIFYLHEECENQIIHCDINPNNILIDEKHSAKIADFGLAKLLMPDQTRTITGIRGTRGFVAPEWHKNMPITSKADVYSFGIVLLVVICCRPSVDVNVPEREAILADWVYERFRANEVKNLVQDEQVNEQELNRMLKIGLWCIQEEPTIRPAMKNVVAMLEGTIDIPTPPDQVSYTNSISHFLDS
ncbi:S-receptor-like serine/threonine-protein kinase [Parasponia andersonii]|uniref:Receptor-like serine/threonine-protein kinase n=1 Tax=Parasponia andersonii TaxID=3476 RepID=A0A2P5DSK8_PARAD|nr:S-receptor-like serine/threonine-protein kinase [Parasponia andersonii]